MNERKLLGSRMIGTGVALTFAALIVHGWLFGDWAAATATTIQTWGTLGVVWFFDVRRVLPRDHVEDVFT